MIFTPLPYQRLSAYFFNTSSPRNQWGKNALVIMILLAFVTGCAGKEKDVPPADILYQNGRAALASGRYFTAFETFDLIEKNYPYSEFTPQAILLAAYAQYRRNDYQATFAKLDTYSNNYPASDKISYVLYLYGLSYYEQISDISRDQGYTKDASDAFNRLINEYPKSIYAQDARVKLLLINDSLAGKEIAIGRYYQNRKLCPAAIGRFKYIVDNYETTAHTPEALYRIVECYLTLAIPDEAKIYAAILGHNYPGSYWYLQGWELMQDYQ